jgi:polysaccharide deacetylase 2 family uncharacterized protein YibQ
MSRTRWALILLASIGALLALLLLVIPRRAARDTAAGEAAQAREVPYPVPEKEPLGLGEPEPVPRPGPQGPGQPEGPARVAIVIDDVGYSLSGLREFLRLPYPLAFAVLPGLPHSQEAGRLIAEAGKELLVHLPMEPSGSTNPGPGAVLTSQSDREIEGLLEESLGRLPGAVGMNNHMGSRATADRRVMEVVIRFLAARGLFFLDSRTTAATVGPETAERLGVPLLERDVFLDNENSPAYIEQALRRGIRTAQARGSAVLIGHVQNVELAVELERLLPSMERAGVALVAPSVLAAERQVRP